MKPGDAKGREVRARDVSPGPAPARRPTDHSAPPWGALVVALGSALAAGATGHLVPGNPGWVAVGVVSVLAGAVALLFVKGPGAPRQSAALPGGGESRGSGLLELESIRRQIELATTTLRGGRDPLAVVSELGMGPLHGLLEAVRDAGTSAPVVSRIAIDEAELVGTDGEQLPEPWPADADAPPAFDPRLRAEALEGVDQMIAGLEALSRDIARPGAGPPAAPGSRRSDRTPAQFVDAVVQAAADGIEDLAAGLMRANELASVAERVTNRATLLALNAALEATRSGSEAFAAIAEETRRLAEFAREATDTISRLANEIEYKVGQTITAIHSTSEDAKHAVAEISGAAPLAAASPEHQESIDALLARAREVRKSLTATMPPRRAKKPRPDSRNPDEGGVRAEGAHAAEAEAAQAEAAPPVQTGNDPAPEPGQPG